MQPRHVETPGMGLDVFRLDFVERHRCGINDACFRPAVLQQFGPDDRAGVEADLTARDEVAPAHGDKVGRTGTGADKMHRHGFTQVHCVTGSAGRQPVMRPSGAARDIAIRVRVPPSSAWLASRQASVTSVTALTTRRPLALSASVAVSIMPCSPAPPPMKIASGAGSP